MLSPTSSAAHRLALWTLLCLAAGCGREYEGDRRYPVSGTVRVDGQPIDSGVISFLPTDPQAQRVAGGPITGGVYSVDEASGPNAGKYRVEIHWYKLTGQKIIDPMTGNPYDERTEGLPDKYHTDSELTVEIPGKTPLDFDLKSQ
jgi:hypothetical protein